MMTSRQRLQATLEHRQPDRVCVDLGATFVSGAHASTVSRLRQALVDDPGVPRQDHPSAAAQWRDRPDPAAGVADGRHRRLPEHDSVRLQEPGLEAVAAVRRHGRRGPGCLHADGRCERRPAAPPGRRPERRRRAPACPAEGTTSTRSSGRNRSTRTISTRPTTPRSSARSATADLADFALAGQAAATETDYGVFGTIPGVWGYGDAMVVPAVGLRRPKGIRDPEEWYISLVARKDYVHAVFRLPDRAGDREHRPPRRGARRQRPGRCGSAAPTSAASTDPSSHGGRTWRCSAPTTGRSTRRSMPARPGRPSSTATAASTT